MECKHDKSEFNTSIVKILHGWEISGRNANYCRGGFCIGLIIELYNKTALFSKYCAKLSILTLEK